MAENDIRGIVKEKYGRAALQVKDGRASCCGSAPSASGLSCDPITSNFYAEHETSALPETAVLASLGCGNPTALAKLEAGTGRPRPGLRRGIDVLLSARRVGPAVKAYGLDMTDEMLELARENRRKAGATNVEFLKGTIEEIPLPDDSVDVIASSTSRPTRTACCVRRSAS
jgi:SAM-dependent methyltransferase